MQTHEYYTNGPDSPIEVSYNSETWVIHVRATSAKRAKALIAEQRESTGPNVEGIFSVQHNDWDRAKKSWPWSFPTSLLA